MTSIQNVLIIILLIFLGLAALFFCLEGARIMKLFLPILIGCGIVTGTVILINNFGKKGN